MLGWDMVTGCLLYSPNESLHVFPNIFPSPASSHTASEACGTRNAYGILLSVFLTVLSSLMYLRSQQRSKFPSGGPSLKANFASFVMTPVACLLASMFAALIFFADVRANIGTVCHLGSALCASTGIIVALSM